MPELPEVETVRLALERGMVGKTIRRVELRRADLRFPFPEGMTQRLEGRMVETIERRAKYLLIHLSGGVVWLAHLGMSGRFDLLSKARKPLKHDHVCVAFQDGSAVHYNDARRFGIMDVGGIKTIHTHPLLTHLGAEPLSDEFTPDYLSTRLTRRKGPVKSAIMDQRLVVGVGNIYASEALFDSRIHPLTQASEVAGRAENLVVSIQKVLRAAIASGGSSLRDFIAADGKTGYFQHEFKVYAREGSHCYCCGNMVSKVVLAGRSTFYCSACQTMPENAKHATKKSMNFS